MAEAKPYVAVIVIQTIYSGFVLLSKAAFDGGMSIYVFNFYRQAIGTVVLVPLAMIFDRRNATPLSVVTMLKIFLLALLGITLPLNAYGIALTYTSATLGAAAMNCIPVSTFLFALFFRMERVKLWTKPGMMKLAGLAICMGGIAMLTFYKGPRTKPLFHHHLLQSHPQKDDTSSTSSGSRWVIGCFLFLASVVAWSLWLIFQAHILKSYPAKLRFTSLQCLSSAVQCFIIAIAVERGPVQWKLGWDMRLFAVAYSGIFLTSLSYYLQLWVIHNKGPVFMAISQPLTLVMTMIGSVLFLGDAITLGSALGGVLLVISLYAVLWGKSKEQKMDQIIIQQSLEAKATEKKETEMTPSEPHSLV